MKGFPNQVAELEKIERAIQALVRISDDGGEAKDDGVLGEALVRAGVAGTGHKPQPIEKYLSAQRLKEPSNQSFRTTARGMRELFRLMRLTEETSGSITITQLGRRAATQTGVDQS